MKKKKKVLRSPYFSQLTLNSWHCIISWCLNSSSYSPIASFSSFSSCFGSCDFWRDNIMEWTIRNLVLILPKTFQFYLVRSFSHIWIFWQKLCKDDPLSFFDEELFIGFTKNSWRAHVPWKWKCFLKLTCGACRAVRVYMIKINQSYTFDFIILINFNPFSICKRPVQSFPDFGHVNLSCYTKWILVRWIPNQQNQSKTIAINYILELFHPSKIRKLRTFFFMGQWYVIKVPDP